MVFSIIVIDSQVSKYPNTAFGKWWRKHVVGSDEKYGDGI